MGYALCKAAADALHADEQEHKREARALVLVSKDSHRGLERERREADALHAGTAGARAAAGGRA